MSNRIYETDKVDNVIGLKDEKKYDKIDIFSERINANNLFGIVYYTEYKKGKPIVKQEIVTFPSYDAMINYVKYNFDTYELTHYVSPNLKHIFFHYVDYCSVDYYLHDGKPNKNYIVLNYREYANGTFYPKSMPFPKEYERLFLSIVNRSKPIENKNQLVYANTIDVNEKRRANRHENYRRYSVPIGEFLKFSANKIKGIKNNRNVVGKLKVVMASSLLVSLLAGGYKLVTNNMYNSEYLENKNGVKNTRDMGIYVNKGQAGIIIEKLMQSKYEEVNSEELRFIIEFLDTIDDSNYDNNNSFNSYDYDDYFDYLLLQSDDYMESRNILKKIEHLYNKAFVINGNKVTINEKEAKVYIDYVASLSFMYDAYHQTRPATQVKINSQSIISDYATTEEISIFDNYPPILRLIILSQLKGLMSHSDYKVTNRPSYYFKDIDKYSLLGDINDKMSNIEDELYMKCGRNYTSRGK